MRIVSFYLNEFFIYFLQAGLLASAITRHFNMPTRSLAMTHKFVEVCKSLDNPVVGCRLNTRTATCSTAN